MKIVGLPELNGVRMRRTRRRKMTNPTYMVIAFKIRRRVPDFMA